MHVNNFPSNCKLYLEKRCLAIDRIQVLIDLGMCQCYDDSINIAMKDSHGAICGWQKRFFSPKRIGEREIKSQTIHGGKVGYFYEGIDFTQPVIVVEGEIDYLSILHLPNVIGIQGAAGLSKLIGRLESQKVPVVYLLLDNDKPADGAIHKLFYNNTSYLSRIYDARDIIGKHKDLNDYVVGGNMVTIDMFIELTKSLDDYNALYQSFIMGIEGKYTINHHAFAKHIIEKYTMLSVDGNVFIYGYMNNNGIWIHASKHQVEHLIFSELEAYFEGVVRTLRKSDRDNVYSILISKTQDLSLEDKLKNNYNQTELNLIDGIYCIKTNTFRPYTKEDYKIHKLSYAFDLVHANCSPSLWLNFLDEILCGYKDTASIVMFLQEFIGHLFLPHTKFEKALLVYGSGANGKGVLLSIIRSVLGDDACTSVGMHEINDTQNAFNLFGKLVNIDTDMQQNVQLDSGAIKKIVSGEPITGKKVYCPPISFMPFVRLIMATNELPYVKTIDDSIKRRFVFLHLKQSFQGREDVTLKDRLSEEKEAIFSRAIQGCKRLLDRGYFIVPQELLSDLEVFLKDNDSVEQFLEDGDVECLDESKIYNQRLYDLYKTYCSETGLKPLSQRKFNSRLVQKGFEKFKDGGGRGFEGLSQKPSVI